MKARKNVGRLVISVSAAGQLEALHMDELPLTCFGRVELQRASTIEFDQDAQMFYVLPTGEQSPVGEAKGFDSYEAARVFEVDWLQNCRIAGVDPHSTNGRRIAAQLR